MVCACVLLFCASHEFHQISNPLRYCHILLDSLIADLACFDETSSRFIQKRLRLGTDEERSLALATALSSFERLWRDQYGNFLIQGLFEFGSTADKKELMESVYGQDVVSLCLHMHGYVTIMACTLPHIISCVY